MSMPCRPPPGFPALPALPCAPEVAVAVPPPMGLRGMCRRPPPGFPSLETTAAGVGMDDTFIMILYNMYLRIRALEREKAELQKKSDQLDTEVWREERAVQRAEEWIHENEENLPKLENILLAVEQKLDQCTVSLMAVIEETEELLSKKDEVYEERERLQTTLDSLGTKLEHPEEVEEEDAQGLIQGYEEHYGTLETAEVLQQVVEVVEETTREETSGDKKTKKKKKKDKKKRTGCFAALWNWARR